MQLPKRQGRPSHRTHPARPTRVRALVRRRGPVVGALLVTSTVLGLVTAPTGAIASPPPNPSDGQISAAAQQKAQLSAEVGRLSAAVASAQQQLRQLQAAEEMAEQRVAYALQKLSDAKTSADQAKAAVVAAQQRVAAAQTAYATFAQANYMSGSVGGTTGSLLTAPDPNVLLQQTALQQYESDHQLDAISQLNTATVAKSNADAAARAAVQRQQQATAAADKAQQEAAAAVLAGRAKEAQLNTTLAQNQQALQTAQLQLATLNHQRAVYIAWQKKQAAIRAARERARERAEARARAAAARERAREAAQRARERAAEARARAHHSGGGGGGSSGGGGGGGSAAPPTGRSWSPQAGEYAVHRAMRYLGWMYAWAGGNGSGPTFGVCSGDGAWNDCHIQGFDCSGLTLYGWAPYLSLPHYSVAQYHAAGSFHPSLSHLEPGDLVFWSANGSVSGIHHVAMYIGHGDVIQAPESGSVIQITPLLQVDWGLFGATRPLT